MVERRLCKPEVGGSIPLISTIFVYYISDTNLEENNSYLIDNLRELKKIVMRICIIFIVTLFCTFLFENKLINMLIHPLKKIMGEDFRKLVVLSPTEGVLTYLKVDLWLSLLLIVPYIIVEVWLFIKPALYSHEKRILGFILFSSIFFSYSAIASGYILIIPYFLKFLVEFLPSDATTQYSLENYVVFFFSINMGLIIAFQTPLVTFGLVKLGLLSRKGLLNRWKIVVIVALVVSAVITPTTDPLSQIIFALPIIVLYFLGILFTYMV